jgi:IclR family transcriptional regulator, acetate operon repressor
MSEISPLADKRDRSPVLKAFRLLTYLAASRDPVALAELSRALKMPKPTTHRLARSIERAGFVHKDPLTRRYRVGSALEELVIGALRHGAGHAPRRLVMNGLAARLGADVNLVVLKGGNLSAVEWAESTAPLHVDIASSSPMPAHCTAGGKLLLAFGSSELRNHFQRLAPLRPYTKKTITSGRAFARELDKIRRLGFAEDDQELSPGVNCLAVPIHNRAGDVVAGLAVMAPAATLPLKKIRSQLHDIRKCAAKISEELGGTRHALSVQRVGAARLRRSNSKDRRASAKRDLNHRQSLRDDKYPSSR